MKKILFIILISFFACKKINAQLTKTIQCLVNEVGGQITDLGDSLLFTSGGGNIYISYLDTIGLDTLRTFNLNSTGFDGATCFMVNGKLYFSGSATGFSGAQWNLFLGELDKSLDSVLFVKSYNSAYPMLWRGLNYNGNFYLSAISKNDNTTFNIPWDAGVLKINSVGDTITQKFFNSGKSDEVNSTLLINDKLYLFGSTSKIDTLDMMLMCLDTNLNFQYARSIGGAFLDAGGYTVLQGLTCYSASTGFNSFGFTDNGILIIKHDLAGNIISGNYITSNTDLFCLDAKMIDGRFYISSIYDVYNTDKKSLMIVLDTNLQIKNHLCLNLSQWDENFGDVKKIDTNRLVFSMSSDYSSWPQSEVKLVTTDNNLNNACLSPININLTVTDVTSQLHSTPFTMTSYHQQFTVDVDTFQTWRGWQSVTTDCVVGQKEIYQENDLFSAVPNPFTNSVSFVTEMGGEYEIRIFDVSGKIIKVKKFSGNNFIYENSALSNGIYFYEIRDEKKIVSRGKLVRQ